MTGAHETADRAMTDTYSVQELRTPRLLLRRWIAADAAEMARINRDPEVGRFLNRPVDGAAIAAFYGLMVDHWRAHGYGPWAIESSSPALKDGSSASPAWPMCRRSSRPPAPHPSWGGASIRPTGDGGWRPKQRPRPATTRSAGWRYLS